MSNKCKECGIAGGSHVHCANVLHERYARLLQHIERQESSTEKQPYINSGKHLGAVRRWIKWNCPNGERVTWGSSDSVGNMTVAQLEEIAQRVADAVRDE